MKESDFKFLGYRISKISFEIKDSFGKCPEKIEQSIDIENNFNKDKPKFVEIVLNVNVKTESESLLFFVKMKGGFEASDNISDKQFKLLSKQNGPAIMFPFVRSIITSYTAQANIQPIILPTINFVIKKENEK